MNAHALTILDLWTEMRLTKSEAAVLAVLMSEDRHCPCWEIGVKGLPDSKGGEVCMKVFLSRLRSKYRKFFDTDENPIEARYSLGYRLSDGARERLQNWKSQTVSRVNSSVAA